VCDILHNIIVTTRRAQRIMAANAAAGTVAQAIQAAAVAQVVQANAQVAAQPPPPPVIHLWPGSANNQALDYTKPSDLKMFLKSIEALTTKFDLQAGQLKVFLECVKERIRIYDWTFAVTIPDSNAINRSLVDEYGRLTITDCQTHAATYVNVPGRNAQNSVMLYQFLSNSLSDDAKNIIMVDPDLYTITGQPSGACLLKVIIGKSTVDKIATVHVLRNTLANLEMKMKELNGNVKLFNLHVVQVRNSLIARGEPVNELMLNLFKGYAAVGDDSFVRYIARKQDAYEDGIPLSVEELMMSALNKYELRIENGTWMALSSKNERIIALQAQIDSLGSKSKDPKGSKKKTKPKGKEDEGYAWKKVPPVKGENTKTVKGKSYHWCPKHIAWTIHTPEQCNLSMEPKPPIGTSSQAESALTLNPALQAIINDDSSDDSQQE
jgi:hypothetical protein